MRLGYGDKVTIDDPADRGDVRDAVGRSVARYGLLLSDDRPLTNAPVGRGTVRVCGQPDEGVGSWLPRLVARTRASSMTRTPRPTMAAPPNASLAAMIANPEDLVHGHGTTGGSDPSRIAKAIDAFRKAAPSGGGGSTVSSAGGGGH